MIRNFYRSYSKGVKIGIILILPVLCFSCFHREPIDLPSGPINGLRPVYMEKAEAMNIEILPPAPLKHPGKIYVYGNFLLINDVHSGIHVINNADPENPVPLSFIKIIGNVDLAVKSNILYADNAGDMVALNITDLNNIQVVKRIDNVFPVNYFPNQTGVYFECADSSKGIVVGWEETVLENITCRR